MSRLLLRYEAVRDMDGTTGQRGRWRRRLAAALGFVAAAAGAWQVGCATTSGTSPDPATQPTTDDQKSQGVADYAPLAPGQEARRGTARAEIGEATRVLDAAGDACGIACPAVQTLRLGVRHLCAVSDTKEDDKVCKESRAQLLAVETRLKPPCGTCAAHVDAGEGDAGDP